MNHREKRAALFFIGCLVIAVCTWPGGLLLGLTLVGYAARM